MKNNIIIFVIIALLIGGVAGFVGGIIYQKNQKITPTALQGRNGQFFQRIGGTNGARPIDGKIISADDKSITVKLNDGSTKIVLISSSTAINKADKASVSDLKEGETIAAFGTTNSDGSMTATNIQLNPAQGRFFGGQVSPMPTK